MQASKRGSGDGSNDEITVKLTATVDVYRRVDEGESYAGERYCDADTFEDEPDQIIARESRDMTATLRFDGGNPNLDAYTYGVYVEGGPGGRFDEEIIETLDISRDVSVRCDWEVSDWSIDINGTRDAWKAQVVTWCNERPDETAESAIQTFRSWNRYDDIHVHVPDGLSVTLPWESDDNEPMTDGGKDTPLTQEEYLNQMEISAEEIVVDHETHVLENDSITAVDATLNWDRWLTHGNVELHLKIIEHSDFTPKNIRTSNGYMDWPEVCKKAARSVMFQSLVNRVRTRLKDSDGKLVTDGGTDVQPGDVWVRGDSSHHFADDIVVIDDDVTTTTFHRASNDRPVEMDRKAFRTMLNAFEYGGLHGEEAAEVREACDFYLHEPSLSERAYQYGYSKYVDSDIARGHVEFSEEIELIPSDSADFANNTMPHFRSMAGCTDHYGGTYQERNSVVVEMPNGSMQPTDSGIIADELLDTARSGAYDACEGLDSEPPESLHQ